MTIIYEQAFPGQLSKDWNAHLNRLNGNLKPRSGDKVTAEFHIWQIALEIKYRSGSYENTRKQALCARYIRAMGLMPLMMCLRPSPNTSEFRRAGWTVLEGLDALERIALETGIDPEAVLRIVGQNPRIRQLRKEGQAHMFARLSDLCTGHYQRSYDHVAAALHHNVASNPDALLDVLRQAEASGTLRDAVEAVYVAVDARDHAVESPGGMNHLIGIGRDLMNPERPI